ncbi:MAG: hypothetical protein ABL971_01440 [Vicinamibacterales bacterium]
MKILFSISHPGFLRNFESGLRHLLLRGHRVHVLLGKDADPDSVTGAALQVLGRVDPGDGRLTSSVVSRGTNGWTALAADLRAARDYWRYLRPEYDDAPLLRGRARAETPAFAVNLESLLRFAPARRFADALVHATERRLPVPDEAGAALNAFQPDVVVVTPLLYFRSDQVNIVRAARARRLPVVYASGSWDHLTTKGLLHEKPDLALVWNDAQIAECVTQQGLEPAHCRATGAQAFDHWFGQQLQVDRAAFCATAGVPADRPLLLYLCSSVFIAGDERQSVREWLAAIRSAEEPIRSAAVIVRPHPQNAAQWRDETFDDGLTVVWPREGANPVGEAARADFYHSIYFSDAVVGVNTSAQIESAIVGRPVFTILSTRYAGTQSGTLHFRHLQKAGGGLLHTASTMAEHVRQLGSALGSAERDAQSARFVAAFVRPAGPDIPAGQVFAEQVERATAIQPPVPDDWRAALARRWLPVLAAAADNASRLRATTASPRFQEWFMPPAETFRMDHTDPERGRRVAWVAASAEDVERFVPLSAALAGRGAQSLLCVPDGSRAGVAAKAARDRITQCVVVGIPKEAAQVALLLRKFRATGVFAFADSAGTPAEVAVSAAARRIGIPLSLVDLSAGPVSPADVIERALLSLEPS